jgi:hypothetical protein
LDPDPANYGAPQELGRQLREAFLYAHRYNKGWERVVELQALYGHYQEAVQQSQGLPPAKVQEFLNVFAGENVSATVIGEFTGTKRLELFYEGCQVCDLSMGFLHEGNPQGTKEAIWAQPKLKAAKFNCPKKGVWGALRRWDICFITKIVCAKWPGKVCKKVGLNAVFHVQRY